MQDMTVLRIFLLIILFIFLLVFVGSTFIAYSKRKDLSFWGGADIICGWWLVFPYGKYGIKEGNKELVFWGRASFSAMMFTAWVMTALP